MHIIQLSHVLRGKVVQVFFFYSNTYTDCLVAEFPVLEHLYSTSLLEVYFLFSIENEKLTEVVNA